ncbi:UDP-N-acetylglucosamine-peptide N-acetylglucosaminyltransferase [Leisingera sp. HS039]|uniref:O-linked N-acetylglucosamine transferase, SPINDLY family protein n=1 Tax=unclassified Leisingera TaxID=2614906 RepID=UPI00142FBC15|nr:MULTISPECIES: UDP-N-acetylglucosamine-peptide N-acetylglucosaminyltransferase [unclassified Leisingera]MBQ4827595.1 UDP-N-acetylglucosamine-peptide N-acetylglucosaminyltransferase [Leisingera sp. HS039]
MLHQALKIEPANTKCQIAIANFLLKEKREEDALDFFELAVGSGAECSTLLSRMLYLKLKKCEWNAFEGLADKLRFIDKERGCPDPFMFLPLTDNPGYQKRRSARMAKALEAIPATQPLPPLEPRRAGKIRLGYFSNDFFGHATMFLMGGMFALHDREEFEIFIYDTGSGELDQAQRRVRQSVDSYKDVSQLSDRDIAKLARKDGIDVAIDLKGHTAGSRLGIFCYRAAPVQVSYLGYPGTTALREMDYLIGDAVTVPKSMRAHYAEKILYMPGTYQVNDGSRVRPGNMPDRNQLGLPEGSFVFCSFNNPYKISPDAFKIWMDLLKEVPDSVLWLLEPSEAGKALLLKEARNQGAGENQIIFANRLPQAEHLARLPHADLFLDTFNYNAHTTASEALWSGVPVVTKPGKQFSARVATSLLRCVGLQELTAETPKQYHALALKLARDPAYLADVKARVKNGIATGPLYDTEKFTRNFEALMEKAVERFNAGLKPDHISLT